MANNGKDRITGFEPLGFSQKQSQTIAQHILSAVQGHVVAVPDDSSTVNKWDPINSNLVSVGQSVLRAAGLSDHHIEIMRHIGKHPQTGKENPLDPRFYDGPDGRRFTFLLNGLEEVAGVSAETSKKYASLFERNGSNGLFKGIQVRKGR